MNLEAIEPLSTLGIKLIHCDLNEAKFHLPLIKNRNDKGTLFAGSQYSALVLAGWYLASYWANEHNLGVLVAIKDSHVAYPKAALTDLAVTSSFIQTPDQRGSGNWRAKIIVNAVDEQGNLVSELTGDYRILTS